jgi:hypothetical protein
LSEIPEVVDEYLVIGRISKPHSEEDPAALSVDKKVSLGAISDVFDGF